MTKRKQQRFNAALKAAKKALDEAGIPFHLHSGTSLGAHREKKFIEHDEDIDIAVFRDDWNRKLVTSMKKHGFTPKSYSRRLGTLKTGKEYSFHYKNGIPLDIFLVYKGRYKNKDIFWYPSFFEVCDEMRNKTCRWHVRPYKPIRIKFMGEEYYTVPKKTLVDMYGKDWKTPKKFTFEEGMADDTLYVNLIKTDRVKKQRKR